MKQKAVIFDVDGTIALRDTSPVGRSPYDMTRVGEDLPNIPVLTVARLLAINAPGEDVAIIFVSGRDQSAGDATRAWLQQHFGSYDYYLYLREGGDNRPDETMKYELLQDLRKAWDIIAAFDDRNVVVDMWRASGVTCFQVCSREKGAF